MPAYIPRKSAKLRLQSLEKEPVKPFVDDDPFQYQIEEAEKVATETEIIEDPFVPEWNPTDGGRYHTAESKKRGQVYNPRLRRWEWADTFRPVDEKPKELEKQTQAADVDRWRREGLFFGQYAGHPLKDVPTDYLREVKTNNGSLRAAIKAELETRRTVDG